MPPDDFLRLVTSQEWRAKLAKLSLSVLAGRTTPEELADISPPGQGFLRWICDGNAEAGAEYYLSQNRDVPAEIVRAMLDARKPKKGGRHSHEERWAEQKASDIACYLAMEYLRKGNPGLSQTAAGERVGRLMHLSCPAVVRAWKKIASETHP